MDSAIQAIVTSTGVTMDTWYTRRQVGKAPTPGFAIRTLRFVHLSLAVLLAACARSQAATVEPPPGPAAALPAGTTVILARHAERLDQSADSPLSEAGTARAESLAAVLDTVRVDAVIVTERQRTRLTAQPLLSRRRLEPVVVATGPLDLHVGAVAAIVRERFAGRTILVVGHSNTVPAIARALGATDARALADGDYGDLFIVRSDGRRVTVTMGRFGP